MRIQSDFKDFYDVGMSQGQDLTLVYQRYEKKVQLDHYPFSSWFGRDHYRSFYGEPALWTDQFMIGFCGILYPVVELNEPSKGGVENSKEARSRRVFCYSLEDIDHFVEKNYPKQYEDYTSKGYRKGCKWPSDQRRGDFTRFFECCQESRDKYARWFEEERCPIFVGHSRTKRGRTESWIAYNAPLRPLEFFRVFDPYTAFQEISMWLGNQAEPRKPIPPITDEVMAEIKGFDKFSFRKDKSKK